MHSGKTGNEAKLTTVINMLSFTVKLTVNVETAKIWSLSSNDVLDDDIVSML